VKQSGLKEYLLIYIDKNAPTLLFCDNQGVLMLAKKPIFHECTRHVDIHCNFIQQLVEDGVVELKYRQAQDYTTEILTKSLGQDKFVKLRDKVAGFSLMLSNTTCIWAITSAGKP
jgi:hypothetical protein